MNDEGKVRQSKLLSLYEPEKMGESYKVRVEKTGEEIEVIRKETFVQGTYYIHKPSYRKFKEEDLKFLPTPEQEVKKDDPGIHFGDVDIFISGWVARNKNGELWLFEHHPFRDFFDDEWMVDGDDGEVVIAELNPKLFPKITWESEPEHFRFKGWLKIEE